MLLISDNIGTKKVFTKINSRWNYYNIRIKKRDKWKAVFTTSKGLFELTVIFFRLTNSPAMFQAIVNKLLKNLINIEKVGSFINNIIVGTKSK